MAFNTLTSSAALLYDGLMKEAGELNHGSSWRTLLLRLRLVLFFNEPPPPPLPFSNLCLFIDKRVEDWPMMSSPFPQAAVILSYVYFVSVLGPRLMENRKPFELKRLMIIYNFSIVAFSLYMVYEVSYQSATNSGCGFSNKFVNRLALFMNLSRVTLRP